MNGLIILIGIVIVLIIFAVSQYNRLIQLRNAYKNSFAQINVELKRRHDLIPNLVETAKAYMAHERETLENVIQARNQAQQINTEANAGVEKLSSVESTLSQALGRFFAVAESYPELKSNQNMMQLSNELSVTENKIATALQDYNRSVTGYNTAIESFPLNLISSRLGFHTAALFETLGDKERNVPQVSFG